MPAPVKTQRRALLHQGATAALAALGLPGLAGIEKGAATGTPTDLAESPQVKPRPLVFPRDAGTHSDFKTEWWYLTGWGKPLASDALFGFQITFFRSRVDGTQRMQSRLAARHLLFAHAAITDVATQRMWHDQRIARWSGQAPGSNPADRAWASEQDTGLLLRDWSLLRTRADLQVRASAYGFALDLRCVATQPVLLQGQQGVSRKGPAAEQASFYYSLPQLQVSGTLTVQGRQQRLASGSAWLDHEWSEAMLAPNAVGWDWLGINLLDGSALTAFQLRDRHGAALWDGGSFRAGRVQYTFDRGAVQFQPLRRWHSPLSQASYPVEWQLRTPAGNYTVRALLDNQELDSRPSTGAIYWEGLCEVRDSKQALVGRGYLEMTGYASTLRLNG